MKYKDITNIRKLCTISTMCNKYNNYIQYIQTINTATMSGPFSFDKFRENTLYLSYLGEFSVLYLIYFSIITQFLPQVNKENCN